jgi:enamine deaminase RidA (YjgF/YER057c/UK114 family)
LQAFSLTGSDFENKIPNVPQARKTDGHHARSALGFSSLPFGAAVEIEAIFEIKD